MAFGQFTTKVRRLFPSSEPSKVDAPQRPGYSSSPLSVKDIRRMQREVLRFLWLRGKGFSTDGSSSAIQLLHLANAVRRRGALLVGEIGFNAGLSSYALLSAESEVRLVSFDLGEHACTKPAKQLIDRTFPDRHTLVYGDSRQTVPEFHHQNPELRFDLVFIDGGHEYEVAKADLANMRALCTEKTVVIMDDMMPWRPWGTGPTQAWTDAIREGIVSQDELLKDGKPVDVIEPPGKRSWAIGHYIFD